MPAATAESSANACGDRPITSHRRGPAWSVSVRAFHRFTTDALLRAEGEPSIRPDATHHSAPLEREELRQPTRQRLPVCLGDAGSGVADGLTSGASPTDWSVPPLARTRALASTRGAASAPSTRLPVLVRSSRDQDVDDAAAGCCCRTNAAMRAPAPMHTARAIPIVRHGWRAHRTGAIASSPIWRSACQGVGVDGHCLVVVVDVVAACGAVRASAGSRRWSCSYSGAGPRPLFVARPLSIVERGRRGARRVLRRRIAELLCASRGCSGRLASRNGL